MSQSTLFGRREPAPLRIVARLPSYPWFAVGTVCIGAFMGQLDASIAQLVLPTLQTTFHAPLAEVSWVALSYLLVLASTLPIFGRLADMFGRKLLYTGGFVIFIIGSALCGFAHSLSALIGARALQALGAGLLQANSVAIITAAAGPCRRGRAIGVQGAAQAIGLSLGPALGGFLIQALDWRWVFWINVPFGIAGALLGWLILPRTKGLHRANRSFDWLGAGTIIPALALVTLSLSEMSNWGASSPLFLGTMLAGVTFAAAFIMHERRTSVPIVELALFRSRAFSAGNAAGLISYGLMFGVFLLLPFALERGYGDTPFGAGLRLTAIPLALGIAAPFAGALSDRLGARALTVGGMLIAAVALAGMSFALGGHAYGLAAVTIAMIVFGFGQGLFTAPNNSSIMGAAPHSHLGAAGGVLNVMRTLGTSLGVAAASVMLDYRAIAYSKPGTTMLSASPHAVLAGIRDVLIVFTALALVASALSVLRGKPAPLGAQERAEIAEFEVQGGV
jgi:EmrB/QacA subfamily drug resistance transporter